jgi:hypothetical protein
MPLVSSKPLPERTRMERLATGHFSACNLEMVQVKIRLFRATGRAAGGNGDGSKGSFAHSFGAEDGGP